MQQKAPNENPAPGDFILKIYKIKHSTGPWTMCTSSVIMFVILNSETFKGYLNLKSRLTKIRVPDLGQSQICGGVRHVFLGTKPSPILRANVEKTNTVNTNSKTQFKKRQSIKSEKVPKETKRNDNGTSINTWLLAVTDMQAKLYWLKDHVFVIWISSSKFRYSDFIIICVWILYFIVLYWIKPSTAKTFETREMTDILRSCQILLSV